MDGAPGDGDLIRRCVDGHRTAWEDFVRTYVRLVASVARKALGTRGAANEADVEDVVEEVFTYVVERNCQALRRLREPYNLKAWLAVVARHKALDHLKRKDVRMRPLSLDQPVAGERSPRAVLVQPEAADAGAASLDFVREAVEHAKLNPKERFMLSLVYFEGRSYRQVSELMGVPENSVGPTVSRALAKVKTELEQRKP